VFEALMGQIYIVRTGSGYFYTGSIIVIAMTLILLAYLLRKGERGAFWVFLVSLIAWTYVEVYIAVSGVRMVTPLMLMGGLWVSPVVPAVFRGVTDGALPVLLAYLFAKSLYMRNYRNVLLVLAFLVFYLGVEAAFEAVGAAAGVLHPSLLLLGVPVWNAAYSVRWIFRPSSVGTLLLMTVVGLAIVAWRRNGPFWKFTTYYFLYLVIYTAYASLSSQQLGFKRWAGVLMPFVGFDPATLSLAWLSPVEAALRLALINYGIPVVMSFYPLVIPVCLVVPADFFRAVIAYVFDVTIEVAGIYLPFLAIPVALGVVELPEEEVSKASMVAHALALTALTLGPLAMGVWLSSTALSFASGFVRGIIAGIIPIIIALAVAAALKKWK